MKLTAPLLLCVFLGCSTAQNAPTPQEAEALKKARLLLRQEQYDEALLITDKLLKENGDNREALLVAADGNLALFASGREGTPYFLEDATRCLEQAIDLDRSDPKTLLRLSDCYLKNSEFSSGEAAAQEALQVLNETGGANEDKAKALIAIADNQMQVFVDERRREISTGIERPEKETGGLAQTVLTTLNFAHEAGAIAPATRRSASVYLWLNSSKQALDILARGIAAVPDDNAMHEQYQQLFANNGSQRECVAAYKRLCRENKGNSVLVWFLGVAQVRLADSQRRTSNWEKAESAYSDAHRSFADYRKRRSAHRQMSDQWLAIIDLSLARVAYEQGSLVESKRLYFQAYEDSSQVAEFRDDGFPMLYDSFGGNYLGGLSLIGQALAEGSKSSALSDSLVFYEKILAKHPGVFGSIYNNAALSARDLGIQLSGEERRGGNSHLPAAEQDRLTKEAMALWERSYKYYCKAVELEPNDERIVNDCGLMLVYYLHREYDRARELFDRAIAVGTPKVDALADDAPAAQRNNIEEAVGDAWQNIAVLNKQLGKGAEDIIPFCEKAVQYYPYQKRQAAAMIREQKEGKGNVKKQASAAPEDPRKAQFASSLAIAKAKADTSDYDGALLEFDKIANSMVGYAPYHYWVGTYSLSYADQQAASGGNVGLVDGLYADALRQLKKSVELDGEEVDPQLELGRAQLARAQWEAAANTAEDLLSHIRSMGGAKPEVLLEVHKIRAQGAARSFVKTKQAGKPNEASLRNARNSFRELESTNALEASARKLWVSTEQWAGAKTQAIGIVIRALKKSPNDGDLLGQVVTLANDPDLHDTAIETLSTRTDALGLWYCGKARFDKSQTLWANNKSKDGIGVLALAIANFRASMQKNAQWKDSCEQWIALCQGCQGLLYLGMQDYATAEASFLSALKTRSDVLTSAYAGGSTIKNGILIVAGKYYLEQKDLGKTEALYRAASELAPQDVVFANNHGLLARDYGTELEREGDKKKAMEMYEHSYAAYTRAAELDPTNIRLRNDRALLLIYHLNRDLDTARKMLELAITDGDKQLQENAPTDKPTLQLLQEAVGDAYQNLGYYQMQISKDYPAARANLEKSLTYFAAAPRESTRHLAKLDKLEAKK